MNLPRRMALLCAGVFVICGAMATAYAHRGSAWWVMPWAFGAGAWCVMGIIWWAVRDDDA